MSQTLSKSLNEYCNENKRLNDDSKNSEKILSLAMEEVILYAQKLFKNISGTVNTKNKMTLYECQEYFHNAGGPEPNPINKNLCMRPDGGILMLSLNGKDIPILIVEDKVQGTNDNLFAKKCRRQATGNAIERGAKNIRGAEMIFSGLPIFPYVLFASGCDFHETETISKRIDMMNMGITNHYIDINKSSSDENTNIIIENIKKSINIKKVCGIGIASVFIKAHKWNEMVHGASMWKKNEIVNICKKIIDNVYENISTSLIQDTLSQ
jgi:hypothetical protein